MKVFEDQEEYSTWGVVERFSEIKIGEVFKITHTVVDFRDVNCGENGVTYFRKNRKFDAISIPFQDGLIYEKLHEIPVYQDLLDCEL